jgi:hypothetical protein
MVDIGLKADILREEETDMRLLDIDDWEERPDATEEEGEVDRGVEISEVLVDVVLKAYDAAMACVSDKRRGTDAGEWQRKETRRRWLKRDRHREAAAAAAADVAAEPRERRAAAAEASTTETDAGAGEEVPVVVVVVVVVVAAVVVRLAKAGRVVFVVVSKREGLFHLLLDAGVGRTRSGSSCLGLRLLGWRLEPAVITDDGDAAIDGAT